MRRKRLLKSYFQLLITLLVLITIPKGTTEKIQGTTIAALAPAWNQLNTIKHSLQFDSDVYVEIEDGKTSAAKEEIHRLTLENQLLANEVNRLKGILEKELFIQNQLQFIPDEGFGTTFSPLAYCRQKDLARLIHLQLKSIPAEVIFRSPSSWNSSLWINIGEKVNETLDRTVVAKNSPVVLGSYVVGVIDYVGKYQSRVRLITDSGLNPSVRAVRVDGDESFFLAKGELRGIHKPAWRKQTPTLKGVGFNYDFADEEGPARDLRTGSPIGDDTLVDLPIIQQDDMLVTTGMDGVFPPGLQVARVTEINLLKEGDYYYELEAVPLADSIEDLTLVYVLPPFGYNPYDQPPAIGR